MAAQRRLQANIADPVLTGKGGENDDDLFNEHTNAVFLYSTKMNLIILNNDVKNKDNYRPLIVIEE